MSEQQYWDQRANTYDGLSWVHNPDLLRWTVGAIQAQCPYATEALDIGCGSGALSEALHKVGIHYVIGCDLSPAMVKRAIKRTRSKAPNDSAPGRISFIAGTSDAFEGQEFQIVASRMVLHHMPNPEDAIHDWFTLVAKDGILAIAEGPPVVPSYSAPSTTLYTDAMNLKEPGRHIFHAYEIAQWMLNAGAREITIHERYSEGNSVKNWLDGSAIDGELRAKILALHVSGAANPLVAGPYRLIVTDDGDVRMRWRHCVVTGRK